MVDMGLEPYLLATSLLGVLSQRLVRVLCNHCKESRPPNTFEQDFLKGASGDVCSPVGCDKCSYTGYHGRTGIYELLILDDHARQMVHDQASEIELNAYARTRFPSIRDKGRDKVLEGIKVSKNASVTADS